MERGLRQGRADGCDGERNTRGMPARRKAYYRPRRRHGNGCGKAAGPAAGQAVGELSRSGCRVYPRAGTYPCTHYLRHRKRDDQHIHHHIHRHTLQRRHRFRHALCRYRGAHPAAARSAAGAGERMPRAYLFSRACSQPAGYWRFKSTPRMFAFQPEGNGKRG